MRADLLQQPVDLLGVRLGVDDVEVAGLRDLLGEGRAIEGTHEDVPARGCQRPCDVTLHTSTRGDADDPGVRLRELAGHPRSTRG